MRIEVEAKSLQLALVRAAGKLCSSQDEIRYSILGESSGVLGFGKKVRIRAWIKESHEDEVAGGSAMDAADDMLHFLKKVLEFLDPAATVLCAEDQQLIAFDVHSDELRAFARLNPRLPEALEHLVRKAGGESFSPESRRLVVDIGGLRQERRRELEQAAQKLAEQVARSEQPMVLNYRSAFDRKMIHLSLESHPQVETKSIGFGPHRKLIIMPRREANGGAP